MFGLFKSKELVSKEAQVTNIGKMLFGQISIVRDKTNAGQIDENIFNQRINSMFAVAYLIGYVDEHLSKLFTDEKSKNKYAKRIFEGIFPRTGVKLVQSKLAARRIGETISLSTETDIDIEAFVECQHFDTGISAGRYDVCKFLESAEYTPNKLEQYLSTGEIK